MMHGSRPVGGRSWTMSRTPMPDPAGEQHETADAAREPTGVEAARPTILDAVEVGGTWTVLGDGRRREVRRRRRRRWSVRSGAAAAGAAAVLVAGVATGYWL